MGSKKVFRSVIKCHVPCTLYKICREEGKFHFISFQPAKTEVVSFTCLCGFWFVDMKKSVSHAHLLTHKHTDRLSTGEGKGGKCEFLTCGLRTEASPIFNPDSEGTEDMLEDVGDGEGEKKKKTGAKHCP